MGIPFDRGLEIIVHCTDRKLDRDLARGLIGTGRKLDRINRIYRISFFTPICVPSVSSGNAFFALVLRLGTDAALALDRPSGAIPFGLAAAFHRM